MNWPNCNYTLSELHFDSNTTVLMRVLVVDDDPAICEYMKVFLGKDGYTVDTLSDPTLAENMIKKNTYAFVIQDLMMPKMDGIELLSRIRKADPELPVIIFTGYPSLDSAVAAMQLKAVDYLKKPFHPDEFRAVIQRVRPNDVPASKEEALHKSIGEVIRNMRKDRNLTLKQLATKTQLSVSLISQIERAESSASIASLFKIAHALGAPMKEFFGDF